MNVDYIDISIEESFCALQKDPNNIKLYTTDYEDVFVEASELYRYIQSNDTTIEESLNTIAEANGISVDSISIILPYLESLDSIEDSNYEDFIQEVFNNKCTRYTDALNEGTVSDVSSSISKFIKSKLRSIRYDRIIITKNDEGSGYRVHIEFVIGGKNVDIHEMAENKTIRKKDCESIIKFVSKQYDKFDKNKKEYKPEDGVSYSAQVMALPEKLVIDYK